MEAIPLDIHAGLARYILDGMGMFWTSLFRDREFLESVIHGNALSASQACIDAEETRDARNHGTSPVRHREHWAPVLVRLSSVDMSPGLRIGMSGNPEIGSQPPGSPYDAGTLFRIGRNSTQGSTVNFRVSDGPCPTRIATCLCDSIAAPSRMLMPGTDFILSGNVLTVREDHNPFASGNYRIIDDGSDKIAVMWACDAEYDVDNVYKFIGYPIGLDLPSTDRAKALASAIWDSITLGLTPENLNRTLGIMYDVPTAAGFETVERIDSGTVVTNRSVYVCRETRLRQDIKPGYGLSRGEFLTDEIVVHNTLSYTACEKLINDGSIRSILIPPGGVSGSNTGMSISGEDMHDYIPAILNTCLVMTDRPLQTGTDIELAYDMLMRLVPSHSGLHTIHSVEISDNPTIKISGSFVSLAVEPTTAPSTVPMTVVSSDIEKPGHPV